MKYVNQLTDEELTDLFKSFMGSDEIFISLDIDRDEYSISLNGTIKFPDDEVNGEWIETEDSYDLTDFNVRVYSHSGNVTKKYREYMYKKFKSKYAKDYLFR